MPRLNNNMQTTNTSGPGSFQFSAIRLDDLEATEYTLVTIITDTTSSVQPFAKELLKCVKNIISACKQSPRSDNLLVRLLTFNDSINEVHGFKPLEDINLGDYKPFQPYGMTALYDAVYSGVAATLDFADRLIKQDFDANGCVYIITDGIDNASTMTPRSIADKMKQALRQEQIESLVAVLVGLIKPGDQYSSNIRKALTEFQVEADLTQFVDAGDATTKRLAKLAHFVSQSISSQSQALGTGTASQQLQF